jgi:hypothetical protein
MNKNILIDCTSKKEACIKLDLPINGRGYKKFNEIVLQHGIDISHFGKKKSSVVWNVSDEKIREIINSSGSITEILDRLGLSNIGGNYLTLKSRIKSLGINYGDLPRGKRNDVSSKVLSEKESMSQVFIKDSNSRRWAKKYLKIYTHLKPYVCECGNDGHWENKKLVLQLDHIDGDNTNNLLENLRWMCPNCHSQTETFAGRNNKK